MNLIEIFQPSFRGRADRTAIRFGTRVLTFGGLDTRSDAVAHALRTQFGVRERERVAMYLANGLELVLFYLACLKLGAIALPGV